MIIGFCGLAGSGKDTAANFVVTDHKFVGIAFADELKRICKRVYDFTDDQLWGPSESRNAVDLRYPRPTHTWTKLPPRERPLTDAEKAEFPDAQFCVERQWHGCACCGLEGQSKLVRSDEDDQQWQIEDVGTCYLTARFALQILGTEWGRNCFPDTWANFALRQSRLLLGMDRGEPGGYWYDRKLGLLSNVGTNRIPDYIPGVVITDVRFVNEIRAIRAAGGKVVRIVRAGAGLQGTAGQHSSETEQASIPNAEFDAVIYNDESLEALRSRVHHLTVDVLGVK